MLLRNQRHPYGYLQNKESSEQLIFLVSQGFLTIKSPPMHQLSRNKDQLFLAICNVKNESNQVTHASTLHGWLDHYRSSRTDSRLWFLTRYEVHNTSLLAPSDSKHKVYKDDGPDNTLAASHAATRSRVASPITRVFASCPELILIRPRKRHGPRVDTNDSHDTPPGVRLSQIIP